MPENGGELAGFLGEMLMGGLEAMAEGREGRGKRREVRPAGQEALGEIAAHQGHRMAEYFKIGAPYGRTQEGMMRWISEQAAAASAAATEPPAVVQSPPAQEPRHAGRSFAEGHSLRSFAEGDGHRIRSFAEGDQIR